MADPINHLEEVFKYHAPDDDQKESYEAIRESAKQFALVIGDNCPPCADRTAAVRLLRECVMTANASIALGGLI